MPDALGQTTNFCLICGRTAAAMIVWTGHASPYWRLCEYHMREALIALWMKHMGYDREKAENMVDTELARVAEDRNG